MGFFQNIGNAIRNITGKIAPFTRLNAPEGSQIQNNVVYGLAPAARGAFSGTRALISRGANALKTEIGMGKIPLSAKLTGIGLTLYGLTAGKYWGTGKVDLPSSRTVAGITGLAFSPISTAVGAAGGIGEDLVRNINLDKMIPTWKREDLMSIPKVDLPNVPSWPDFPKIDIPEFHYPDIQMPNFEIQAPNISLPSNNISVGGGPSMAEALLPLLLLGGGAAGAAYLYKKHKKKRKKKKKKLK